jgi:SAM-dependent methyltransferase
VSRPQCRICGQIEGNRTLAAREMMFGMRDRFEYIVCSACGCVQIATVPTPQDLARFYPTDYYAFAPPRRHPSRFQRFKRRRHAAHLLGLPNPLGWLSTRRHGVPPPIEYLRRSGIRRSQAVLDVGSGSGARLLDMWSYGCTWLTGIDPFVAHDIEYWNGVRVLKRDLEDYNGRHDLVMLHHTFEHMGAPLAVLERLRSLLNQGGVLLLRVPLASSEAFATYGADWVQLDAPRHLYAHTAKSIALLAKQAGWEILQVVYDSTAFQFWGSEQYRQDIPLLDPRSYQVNPAASIFTRADIAAFESRARQLNEDGRGDQACFYLRVLDRRDIPH